MRIASLIHGFLFVNTSLLICCMGIYAVINFYVFSFEQFGKPGVINPDVQRQSIEALLTSNKPPVENCMRPEFIRLAPPLHIAEDEVGHII